MFCLRSSHCGSAEMNLTVIHEDAGLIPGLFQWIGDLAWLWWCRPVAAAPIQPLALDAPYATGASLNSQKKKKKKKKKKENKNKVMWGGPNPTKFSFNLFYLIFLFSFLLFRAIHVGYGSPQASGQIGAAAASLHHSHSNLRSEPHLQPTPQLTATLDPQPTE